MLLASVYGSAGFNILKLLHIALAIAGFGGVLYNGVYGMTASKKGAEGVAIAEANFTVTRYASFAIYGVFVTGILTLIAGPKAGGKSLFEFSQAWVSASFLLAIIYIGLNDGFIKPQYRKLIETWRSGGQAKDVEQRLAMVGGLNNLVLLVLLYLMIFKPGL